ncbi:molybdopterin-binding protein [Cohnella sp. CFH 77786]|uniref:molybdopterin-binding protein n=1 Tax=Cohnella sp. CFH 77786 TaxID=2662265 RepID=UPI001C610199|nr:molybdopterin-binding protein [Cohnella sp. CFH 77786]MBW5448305.1 molybdopterin-binding protein [Cohnella sp. CFH 77786]
MTKPESGLPTGTTVIGSSVLREVKVEDAVGMVLAHDLTQILPGTFKGRLFRKGHRVAEEDIPKLKDIGKEHLYAIELGEGDLHEDDAALRMAAALAGEHAVCGEPHEGKVAVKSEIAGLAVIAREVVDAVNAVGEIALATVTNHRVVRPGEALAATRAIPLIVPEAKVREVERIAERYRAENRGRSPLAVRPLRRLRAGLLTTGSEVFSGRIADKFGPAVASKLEALGSELSEQRFAPDDRQTIVKEIRYFLDQGYDMILVSGGMSVDPDDRTPGAIAAAGTDIVSYGTPMLPGSMLLFGYLEGVPIFGLPGCVMHDPYTSFDVLLPRVLAGDTITRDDIVGMGYGGLHR